MLSVLLVEDDLDLAATIIDYLELESISCDHAANGIAGMNLVHQNSYQLILLDINMPRMNGLTMCETLRTQGLDTPVLMLTARDKLDDKLAGFHAGADDYLIKPFEIEELLVRIIALSKRRSGQVKKLTLGILHLDLTLKTISVDDQSIQLTPILFKLLETLMRASPEPVSQQDLNAAVWGDEMPDSNSLRVHLHYLRKTLAKLTESSLIKTVPRFGFYIVGN